MYITILTPKQELRFKLFPYETQFYRVSGIYAFLIIPPNYSDTNPFYHLLYVGITNNLQNRFRNHHKLQQAIQQGITHIGIIKASSGKKRKATERILLQALNPPLNQTWL